MSKYTDRINVCYNCPEAQRKMMGLFCNICGCNMKIKARIDKSNCPLDKWND